MRLSPSLLIRQNLTRKLLRSILYWRRVLYLWRVVQFPAGV